MGGQRLVSRGSLTVVGWGINLCPGCTSLTLRGFCCPSFKNSCGEVPLTIIDPLLVYDSIIFSKTWSCAFITIIYTCWAFKTPSPMQTHYTKSFTWGLGFWIFYSPQVSETATGYLAMLKYSHTDIYIRRFSNFTLWSRVQLQRWPLCLHFQVQCYSVKGVDKGQESPTIVRASVGFWSKSRQEIQSWEHRNFNKDNQHFSSVQCRR